MTPTKENPMKIVKAFVILFVVIPITLWLVAMVMMILTSIMIGTM